MTSLSKLLAQKQQLLGRLEEDPGPNERAELERLLGKVDAALSSLRLSPAASPRIRLAATMHLMEGAGHQDSRAPRCVCGWRR